MLDAFNLTSKDGTQKLFLKNGRLHLYSTVRSIDVPLDGSVIVLADKDLSRDTCSFLVYLVNKTTPSISLTVVLSEAKVCLEEV